MTDRTRLTGTPVGANCTAKHPERGIACHLGAPHPDRNHRHYGREIVEWAHDPDAPFAPEVLRPSEIWANRDRLTGRHVAAINDTSVEPAMLVEHIALTDELGKVVPLRLAHTAELTAEHGIDITVWPTNGVMVSLNLANMDKTHVTFV